MKRRNFIASLAVLPAAGVMMNLKDLEKWADEAPLSPRMPVLFVGHGSPMNAIEVNNYTRKMNEWGSSLLKTWQPSAVLVVSAHWLTRGTFVQASAAPEIIYDFGGFPEELYKVKYPVKGSPAMAEATKNLIPGAQITQDWGLDHGAWAVLKQLFPDASVPAFQMSIDWGKPMSYHYQLAATLKSLRNKGVLIVGSGNIVHNLGMSMRRFAEGNAAPYDWAVEFDSWVKNKLVAGDFASLADYESAGTAGKLSVPTPDHYIPMLYSLGLADKSEKLSQVYESVEFGGISMRCFMIGG